MIRTEQFADEHPALIPTGSSTTRFRPDRKRLNSGRPPPFHPSTSQASGIYPVGANTFAGFNRPAGGRSGVQPRQWWLRSCNPGVTVSIRKTVSLQAVEAGEIPAPLDGPAAHGCYRCNLQCIDETCIRMHWDAQVSIEHLGQRGCMRVYCTEP